MAKKLMALPYDFSKTSFQPFKAGNLAPFVVTDIWSFDYERETLESLVAWLAYQQCDRASLPSRAKLAGVCALHLCGCFPNVKISMTDYAAACKEDLARFSDDIILEAFRVARQKPKLGPLHDIIRFCEHETRRRKEAITVLDAVIRDFADRRKQSVFISAEISASLATLTTEAFADPTVDEGQFIERVRTKFEQSKAFRDFSLRWVVSENFGVCSDQIKNGTQEIKVRARGFLEAFRQKKISEIAAQASEIFSGNFVEAEDMEFALVRINGGFLVNYQPPNEPFYDYQRWVCSVIALLPSTNDSGYIFCLLKFFKIEFGRLHAVDQSGGSEWTEEFCKVFCDMLAEEVNHPKPPNVRYFW